MVLIYLRKSASNLTKPPNGNIRDSNFYYQTIVFELYILICFLLYDWRHYIAYGKTKRVHIRESKDYLCLAPHH